MFEMEKGQCLMSTKRAVPRSEYFPSPAFHPFPVGLREDRAAEWIWPPRSYSCSFCTRVFSSAQALGGHMNVHRRDRARLKQQSPNRDPRESTNESPDHNLEAKPSFGLTSSVSTLSSTVGRDNNGDTKDGALKNLGETPRKPDGAKRNKNVLEDYVKHDHGRQVRTELSMGLNSESCRNRASGSSCKRAKTDVSTFPLMLELVLGVLDPSGLKIGSQHEELDLELRLGVDPPKVKQQDKK